MNFMLVMLLQEKSEQVVRFDSPDILLVAVLAVAWFLLVRVGGYRFMLPNWVANLRHPYRLRILCWAAALFLFFDTASSYWFGYRAKTWEADVFLLILGVILAFQIVAMAVLFLSWGRRVGQ